VAAEPMTEQAWREIINSAAKRCDAVRDNGAAPETPTEATAIEDGLSFLICHRRPDITNADDFIMLVPELPGGVPVAIGFAWLLIVISGSFAASRFVLPAHKSAGGVAALSVLGALFAVGLDLLRRGD